MPKRKSIRLQGYQHSQNGAYFITICVRDRQESLCKLDVGTNCVRPHLSEYGAATEKEMETLNHIYECVQVDKYVMMPNHIHMIILITAESGRTQFVPTISRIIKQFKGSITKKIGFSLWQPRFHDHVIRDDAEYLKIWQYIDENPARWAEDCYYQSR